MSGIAVSDGPKTGNAIIDSWPTRFGDTRGTFVEVYGTVGCSVCDNDNGSGPVTPTALPTGAAERKAVPIASGVIDYFPAALAEIARVSKAGNAQHNPGAPLHWARGKSTDQSDCLMRHFMERGTIDGDGCRHSAKMAWRALALLQLELEAAGYPVARGAK
jgi:hypothetical protein